MKIDQSFLRNDDRDGRNAVILDVLIRLGQTLHLDVIAEGAETATHIGQLQTLNCPYVQGFYIGRPMAQTAATAYLDRAMGHPSAASSSSA